MTELGNAAAEQATEIRVRGKNRIVPSAVIDDFTVVVANRWPRIASLKDEEFVDRDALLHPAEFLEKLRLSGLGADLFTAVQIFPDTKPRHDYYLEWDNVAAVPITTYSEWHDRTLNGNQRKILRRSYRRGISVEQADFTDDFVRGVVNIYNETPIRQQRSFWHYGKDFETVKAEASTYPDRSLFLGAYFEGALIGFLKVVFVGRVARLMHILSMEAHMDKVPTNALIAKAVEVCAERECTYLVYGKYNYGNAGYTSLTEFKVRNGFQKYSVPRYYIPLTAHGRLALKMKVHQGFRNLLPEPVFKLLLSARAKYSGLRFFVKPKGSSVLEPSSEAGAGQVRQPAILAEKQRLSGENEESIRE